MWSQCVEFLNPNKAIAESIQRRIDNGEEMEEATPRTTKMVSLGFRQLLGLQKQKWVQWMQKVKEIYPL